VAAESLDIACRAVDLIDVEYEVLPPVLNQLDALDENSPLVHRPRQLRLRQGSFSPQPGTNIPNLTKIRKGDIDAGFAEAKWIVEREYTNPSVQHVAAGDPRRHSRVEGGDEVTIWSSAHPHLL